MYAYNYESIVCSFSLFFVSLLHHHVADKSFGDYFLHELLPSADGCVLCAQFSQLFFISKLLLMQKCNCTPIDYRLCVELFFCSEEPFA